MKPSRIQAVDHVNLEAPPGLREDLRWFYGELAGLEEVAGDPQAPPHLCFRSARLELRIWWAAEPRIDPINVRLTLTVRSLREAAERLEERGDPYVRHRGLLFTDRRLHTHDPAGYAVALKREWPACDF